MLVLKKELEPEEILHQAIDTYEIDSFYVAYSGGKDSGIVLNYVAKNFPKQFKGAIFCNTGIATDACVQFVRSVCKKNGYPLFEVKPSDVKRKKDNKYGRKKGEPFSFEDLVLQWGFPHHHIHDKIMGILKHQPMREFIKQKIKSGEKTAIISGVRKKESARRTIKAKEYIFKQEGSFFVSPLFYKSNNWVMKYYIENGLKRSPVYDTLHISGDCLCGCFAEKSELKLLQMFHPEVFNEIKRLEKKLMEEGRAFAKTNKTWGKFERRSQSATENTEAQSQIENFLCNDCFFDKNQGTKDTERFNDEMEEVDIALNELMEAGVIENVKT